MSLAANDGGPSPAPSLTILVVHPEVPMRDHNSLSVRLHQLLSLMVREGHRVTLLARSAPADQEPYARELERLGIDVIRGDPQRAREARWLATGTELDIGALLRDGDWDVAWLSEVGVVEQYTQLVRAFAPLARVVADTGDVNWLREARGAELAGDGVALAAAERTRAREASAYGAADAIVAVSEADAQALRELAPGVPIAVISNIHAAEPAGPPFEQRSGLVFVGYYGHAPNVDAILHFHATAWPAIVANVPEATLTIVGLAPPPAVTALADARVTVTGWVPSVRPYLDAARVSIAPLRFGAGVKGKIGESLAVGLPVVGTSLAFEGMKLESGEHVLLADEPDQFADAVVRLHTDEALWTRLSCRGRAQVEARLGQGAARKGLRELLGRLSGPMWFGTEDSVAPYLDAYEADDDATLVLEVPVQEHEQAQAVERVTSAIHALGHDPERIPDISLVPTDQPLARPSRARSAPTSVVSRDAWRGACAPRAKRGAIVVLAPDDASLARRQLDGLAGAGLPEDVEIVVAADALSTETQAALARCGSGASIVRSDRGLGRRGILQRAISSTDADVVIVLDSLAAPERGFAEPLLEAVEAGASLAGPSVNGTAGLTLGPSGELVPRSGTVPPQAFALDCIAARRATWLDMPGELPAREGQRETQLARWALSLGPLAPVACSHVRRLAGPPATVVICSHNRCEELEGAVAGVLADGLSGEIVLVDNASTDDTAALGADLVRRHPGVVRLVAEPRAGLSHARNAGLAAARHDLVVFLDDDARPAPGWLAHLATGLARDGVVNAGGPVCALWPESRQPGWPQPGVERLFAVLELADRERVLAGGEHVFGCNWAGRREALLAIGGFDPAFGFSPDTRLGGEEIAAADAMRNRGLGVTRWIPRAAIGHIIPEARMAEPALVRRSLLGGVERVVRGGPADPQRLLDTAGRSAQVLLSAFPLTGQLDLEDAVDRITTWPADLLRRTLAADLLGEVAGCVVMLGESELQTDALTLRVRPEHARGILAPQAA